jgi:hypothetical protein
MGDGAGIFSLLGALLFAPFQLAGAWRNWMRRRPPDTQALTKASHGAGLLALVLFVLAEFVGWRAVGNFARALRAHPDDLTLLLPAALLSAVVIWGAVWLITGWRRAGRGDGLIALIGVLSLAGGIAAFVYAPRLDLRGLALIALDLLGVWFIATGAVKILLVVGGGNALRAITRQLRRQNAPLRPVRPRRRFLFF